MTNNTLSLVKIAARIGRPGRRMPAPGPISGNPRVPSGPRNSAPLRRAPNRPAPSTPSDLVPVRSGPQPTPNTKGFVRPEQVDGLQQSISNIDASFNPSASRYRDTGPVVNGLRLNELDDMAFESAVNPHYTLHATPGARQGVLPGFESYMVARDQGGGLYNPYPADPVQQFARKYFASEPYLSQASLTPVNWRGATMPEINRAIAASQPKAPLTLPAQASGLKRTLPPLIGGVGAGMLGRTLYNNLTGDTPAPAPAGQPAPVQGQAPISDPAPVPAGQPAPVQMPVPNAAGYTLNPMLY